MTTDALARHKFTVEDYHRMAEAGILDEDDRVELLSGQVVAMSPIGSPLSHVVLRLGMLFSGLVASGRAIPQSQGPLRVDEYSEPQPDYLLLHPPVSRYDHRLPAPGDVLLIIEVMDSSRERDAGVKLPKYAESGIPELWLVDVDQRTLEVCRDPRGRGYADRAARRAGATASPQAFADLSIPVDEVFG